MIKDAYCSFEVSKLLKEKGFDESTLTFYIPFEDGEVKFRISSNETHYNTFDEYPWIIAAPTHQMACAWLREVYNIDIITFHEKLPNDCYWARIERDLFTEFEQEPEYNSYEDAVESAIKYCLENLI